MGRRMAVRVVAQDPSLRDSDDSIVTTVVGIPEEVLAEGPRGHRVAVVDYDSTRRVHYQPWRHEPGGDLDRELSNEDILGQPWFHAPERVRPGDAHGAALRARAGAAGRVGLRRAAAAHRAARVRGGQRLLLAGRLGAPVRLLPGCGRQLDLHLAVARHRRPREHPRAARRHPAPLPRSRAPGSGRVPRGVRRHGGAAVGLHHDRHGRARAAVARAPRRSRAAAARSRGPRRRRHGYARAAGHGRSARRGRGARCAGVRCAARSISSAVVSRPPIPGWVSRTGAASSWWPP